jgi:hypothetical protein
VGVVFLCARSRRRRAAATAAAAEPSPQPAASVASPDASTVGHGSGYYPAGGYSYAQGYNPVVQQQQGAYPQGGQYGYEGGANPVAAYAADPGKAEGRYGEYPQGVPDPNAPVELAGQGVERAGEYPVAPHLGAVEAPGSEVPGAGAVEKGE